MERSEESRLKCSTYSTDFSYRCIQRMTESVDDYRFHSIATITGCSSLTLFNLGLRLDRFIEVC